MFNDENIIVGLEIGTSKVCVVVGEQNAEGSLNVVGIGQAPVRGVRKGDIVDPTQAAECVRNAIVEAEQMADVEIRNVYLGVTWAYPRLQQSRVHRGFRRSRDFRRRYPGRHQKAKAINLPPRIRSSMPSPAFFVDGQDGITNPVGMLGARIEVDMHVVHATRTACKIPSAS